MFAAMLAYIGVYLYRSVSDNVRTAPAIVVTLTDSVSVSGIAVRDEYVVKTGGEHVSVSAADGKMVAVGAPVAVSMGSAAALERENRIRTLELEIERLKMLLSGTEGARDLYAREASVQAAVLSLARATSTHDLSDIDGISLRLSSLLFESSAPQITQADLTALELELSGIRNSSFGESAVIPAEKAGIFYSILDGYEHISPEMLSNLSAFRLRELQRSMREPAAGAIGKIICSHIWYFAAVIGEDRAADLKPGLSVTLDFGRYYQTPLKARVQSVSKPENGECVAVFSCDVALVDTLAMRRVTALIVFNEYTGIRIPTQAVHLDRDGKAYVYTITAMRAEKKDIEIIRLGDDYCIAAQGSQAGSLRAGNEIIVNAKNIYEGKLMR